MWVHTYLGDFVRHAGEFNPKKLLHKAYLYTDCYLGLPSPSMSSLIAFE